MTKGGCVYILTNKPNGVLYIGVAADLARRLDQHAMGKEGSFSSRYNIHKLVWYQYFDTIEEAILREKQLIHYKRTWKIELIEKDNPNWYDLSTTLLG